MTNFKVEVSDIETGHSLRMENFDVLQHALDYCDAYNGGNDGPFRANFVPPAKPSPFQRVAELNDAFGNPKGDAENINWTKVLSQCKNIFDEYCELLIGLGMPAEKLMELRSAHQKYVVGLNFDNQPDAEAVRDALCDIQVFSLGAQHLMGYNGDNDMNDVIDGVFTRFIKDEPDLIATVEMHADKGVKDVYFDGEYPKMVMKSSCDQPDAPRGKVLKSFSYTNTKFRPAP